MEHTIIPAGHLPQEKHIPPQMKEKLQRIQADNAEVTYACLSRTKKGYLKLEVATIEMDGSRRFFIIKDKITHVIEKEVCIYPNELGRPRDRNDEIYRLRKEEKLTQQFIAHIFGLTQSRIAQILKKY